jgi:protocatechuate 3,4-dioxygenase beta subunit
LPAATETYTISGTVRDQDNTPVQDVLVSTGWLDPEIAFARTDAQGSYNLMVTTPGAYQINASRFYNRLDPPAQTVTVPPSHTGVDFTFSPYATIRGVVTDPDGLPVEGATVTTDYTDPLYTSALTDASGAYTLAVAAGAYHISVSKSGLVSPPAQRVTIPPNRTEVNFAFFVPYTIQGTVYTFDGKPASGISVATAEDDPMRAFAMTDANGAYTLIVRAGAYHINASVIYLGSPPAQVVTVPPSRSGVDFTMPQPILIRGTVRDDAGRPVAGASVGDGITSRSLTADDGSYTIAVGPGEHWISAYSDAGFYNAYDAGLNALLVAIPPAADGVDFVLRVRNRTIRGRVVDDQGQPVALADVFATNPLASLGQVRETDADGYYTLTVAAGVYWVHTVKHFSVFDQNPNRLTPFYPSYSQEVDVSADSAQAINFMLEPVTGLIKIRGRVRDAGGSPVSAVVSATSLDTYKCYLAERVSTDESGAYTIAVRPGNYSVNVYNDRLPALADQTISVPPEASIDFTFPQLYSLSGRVTDAKGKPLQYVLMQVTSSEFNGIYTSSLSDSDGWYSLIVAAGAYTVTAFHEGFAAPPAQMATIPPERTEINFVLSPVSPPDQLIRGRVLDETGQPAANAVVSLAGDLFGGKTVYYDGSFSRAVYAGTYTVAAGGSSYISSPSQQVTVPSSSTELEFTVRRADQFIFGQVTDEAGNPLCAVKVEASGEAASTYAFTDVSGRFALRVPNGVYTLRASRSDHLSPAAQTVTVPPTATQLKFVLQPCAERSDCALPNTVEGTVQDDQGAPIAGASVTASGAGGPISTTTDAAGKYTLHLADGSWNISIRASGLVASPTSRTVVVPPPQTNVDFQVTGVAANHFVYLPAILTAP